VRESLGSYMKSYNVNVETAKRKRKMLGEEEEVRMHVKSR